MRARTQRVRARRALTAAQCGTGSFRRPCGALVYNTRTVHVQDVAKCWEKVSRGEGRRDKAPPKWRAPSRNPASSVS